MRVRVFGTVLALAAVLALVGTAHAQMAAAGETGRVDSIVGFAATQGVPPVAPGTFAPSVQATDDVSAGFGAALAPYVIDLDAWFASQMGWRSSKPVHFILFSTGDSLLFAAQVLRGAPLSPGDRDFILSRPSYLLYAAQPAYNVQPGEVAILVNTDLDAAAQTVVNLISSYNFEMNIYNRPWPAVTATRVDGMRLTQASMARDYAMAMENDVAGSSGPTFFREGLADAIAFQIAPATPMEVVLPQVVAQILRATGRLPSLATLEQDWAATAGPGGAMYDVARGESFLSASALVARIGAGRAMDILRATATGQSFDSALQSIGGLSIDQLNEAMKVLVPPPPPAFAP